VGHLVARLADEDAQVRQAAAAALGSLKDAKAVDPLIARLTDDNPQVRWTAAEALGSLGDAKAVDPLIARLTDDSPRIQDYVAYALGRIGQADGLQALERLLQSDVPEERRPALGGLAQREEQNDRRLLSRDLDGLGPWLDVRDTVTASWIRYAAQGLGLPSAEVRKRYERLAQKYGLILEPQAWVAASPSAG
jgi:HEAT repeat protein